jgi:hypothetical protein
MKQMILVPLKSQLFMCLDRIDDFKKNIPCLPNNCPSMETACQPKCGSIESSANKLFKLLKNQGPPMPFPGAQGSTAPPASTKELGDAVTGMCTVMSCYMSCGEPIMTKACGKDAFLLQRDYTWVTFSNMVQATSTYGTQTPWPNECNGLHGAASTGNTGSTSPPAPVTPVATVQPGKDQPTTGASKTVCEKCGAATTIVPSIVLFFMTIFVALRDV